MLGVAFVCSVLLQLPNQQQGKYCRNYLGHITMHVMSCLILYDIFLVMLTSTDALMSPAITFSKTMPGSCVFLTLTDQSLRSCMKECDIRPSCRSANYRRMFKTCQLNDKTDSELQLKESSHSVYVRKQEPLAQCDSLACQSGTVCDVGSNDCIMRECPRPYVENSTVYGNVYTPGSRLQLSCQRYNVMRTGSQIHIGIISWECQSNGLWSGPTFTCTYSADVCQDYLVNGNQAISDGDITASSYWENLDNHAPHNARIPGLMALAWVCDLNDVDPFIQAKFPSKNLATSVVTEWRYSDYYVESYTVSYSVDCVDFLNILETNGTTKTWRCRASQYITNGSWIGFKDKISDAYLIFAGNDNSPSSVTNLLPIPVAVRCIRVNPKKFVGIVPAMRFDIGGCPL